MSSRRIVTGDRIDGAGVGYEAKSGVGVGGRKSGTGYDSMTA